MWAFKKKKPDEEPEPKRASAPPPPEAEADAAPPPPPAEAPSPFDGWGDEPAGAQSPGPGADVPGPRAGAPEAMRPTPRSPSGSVPPPQSRRPLDAHSLRPPPSGPLTSTRRGPSDRQEARPPSGPPAPEPTARPLPEAEPPGAHAREPDPFADPFAEPFAEPEPPAAKAPAPEPEPEPDMPMATGPGAPPPSIGGKVSGPAPGGGVFDDSLEFDEERQENDNPFAEFETPVPTEKSGEILMASFPELESAKKEFKPKNNEPGPLANAGDEEAAGDPLLSSGEDDDWAASDSFREVRRELTKRHQRRVERKKKKRDVDAPDTSGSKAGEGGDDFLLEAEDSPEDEGWRPSDSQRLGPMRELAGLGAHEEDQFAEEEEEGLGTRVLAREADDMERDEVDEIFFSDIDLSVDEYSEKVHEKDRPADATVRVVRKLEDTQFIDVEELGDVDALLARGSDDLDEQDGPLRRPDHSVTHDESVTPAVALTDADFARAVRKVPSRRLSRIIDDISAKSILPADQLSAPEFETIFGPEDDGGV